MRLPGGVLCTPFFSAPINLYINIICKDGMKKSPDNLKKLGLIVFFIIFDLYFLKKYQL